MHNSKLESIDSYTSFKVVEKQLDDAVRKGEVTRERASLILRKARDAYRNQDYNKTIERVYNASWNYEG